MPKPMKKTHKIILLSLFIFLIIVGIETARWYKNSIYPYNYAKKCFEENEEHFNNAADYFRKLEYSKIYTAKMKEDGRVEITSANGLKTISCFSQTGYESWLFLRDKYFTSDEERDIFDNIRAEYDKQGNVMVQIPIYMRSLYVENTIDDPSRMVYYLVYYDDNYELDSAKEFGRKKHTINDNWFVFSKSN